MDNARAKPSTRGKKRQQTESPVDEPETEEATPPAQPKKKAGSTPKEVQQGEDECLRTTKGHYLDYFQFSQKGPLLRKKHGTLKIIAFSRLWPPPFHGKGGMQYHAMHLYSQLAARGHTVHVIISGSPGSRRSIKFHVDPKTFKMEQAMGGSDDDEGTPQLTVHQVPSDKNSEYSVTWYENALVKFKELNKTVGGFQVAHSESWAGVPNVYQVGLQMAVTWHGSMLDWFRNEINLIVHNFRMKGKMTSSSTAQRMSHLATSVAFESYSLLTVPHHIVISDSAAEDLRDINLVDADRIHLIYNGVNPKNFFPNPSARTPFLKDHGIDPSFFVVGCGGRLEGIKGHHQLSSAMDRILSQHTDVALLVAGSGGEGKRYEALKAKGLKVVMLGMMTQEKLAAFYQSLDVFVDPFYQHHGLNTVMIEAVLSGTPIVATALASAKTTAPCSDFGRTFGLGEVDQLVTQIVYFKENPEERKQVGLNVRDRATHLFSSAIMAESYEALFYEMWQKPIPLEPLVGDVVCKHAYPAMCYRMPSKVAKGSPHQE